MYTPVLLQCEEFTAVGYIVVYDCSFSLDLVVVLSRILNIVFTSNLTNNLPVRMRSSVCMSAALHTLAELAGAVQLNMALRYCIIEVLDKAQDRPSVQCAEGGAWE